MSDVTPRTATGSQQHRLAWDESAPATEVISGHSSDPGHCVDCGLLARIEAEAAAAERERLRERQRERHTERLHRWEFDYCRAVSCTLAEWLLEDPTP